MARRTKEQAEKTRNAVLDAACEVFLKRGVARATLDEVAQAAGVTRGAVYWHFRDKIDLFLALAERERLFLEGLLTDLVVRLDTEPGLDALGELARSVEAAFVALEGDAERRRLLTVLLLRCEYVAEMDPVVHRQRRADAMFQAALKHVFDLAAARGRLAAPWQPPEAAMACFLLVNGLIQAWLRTPEKIRLTVQGKALVRTFLAALDGVPAGASPGTQSSDQKSRIMSKSAGDDAAAARTLPRASEAVL